MKIKLIDLLYKIANGEEVPERIKYDNKIMKYDHNKQDYKGYYSNGNGDYLFQFLFDKCRNTEHFINDYVEIIEEDKKIEKIMELTNYQTTDMYAHKNKINETIDKINELIDAVNKLKGGNDD